LQVGFFTGYSDGADDWLLKERLLGRDRGCLLGQLFGCPEGCRVEKTVGLTVKGSAKILFGRLVG
jgi:hypothetical protein